MASHQSPVQRGRAFTDEQLRRQSLWLRDSWIWLLDTRVRTSARTGGERFKALDVGCGPGYVMELLGDRFDLEGVDVDPETVSNARRRGLSVARADANDLPYDDGSFDLVYCSFLVLWLSDPAKAIGEMKRVAKRWVICLAEPDYGGRIDHPDELADLTRHLASEIRELGGDPFVGRKLRSFFTMNGFDAEVGVHQGVWSLDTLRHQSEQEWAIIEHAAERHVDALALNEGRKVWEESLKAGELFQFNPVFYAIGRKT